MLISIISKVIFHISDCYLMLLLMVISHLQQRQENAAQTKLILGLKGSVGNP